MKNNIRNILILLALSLSVASALAAAGQVAAGAPSVNEIRSRAAGGDVAAQMSAGSMYFKGEEIGQDFAEAAKWFLAAARKGHAQAQYNIGMMYASGRGVPQDSVKAVYWYRAAAKQGLSLAQLNLGVAYATGQGLAQDEFEAMKWFTLAAGQGDVQAQFNLAVMYANGQGGGYDLVEAYRWAKLAADQGGELAQSLSADLLKLMTPEQIDSARKLLEGGQKTPPSTVKPAVKPVIESRDALQSGLNARKSGDYPLALKLLVPLANKGDAIAQLSLGQMNEQGQGVPRDEKRAFSRYRQAAEAGNAEAQFWLAEKYEQGLGVPLNKKIATQWYVKSAEGGFAPAQAKIVARETARVALRDKELIQARANAEFDAKKTVPQVDESKVAANIVEKPVAVEAVPLEVSGKTALQTGLEAYQSGDYANALKVLLPLANKGDAAAQLYLGMMNEMGQGTAQNYARAAVRYRQAAEQGNAEAQYRLAGRYALGLGVLKDKKLADEWYGKSAALGHPGALAQLMAEH